MPRNICSEQDRRKNQVDQDRRDVTYEIGDKVLLKTHVLSQASAGFTSKLASKRDGSYIVTRKVTSTTYEIATCAEPPETIGRHHVSDLTSYIERAPEGEVVPMLQKKKRGRPKTSCILPEVRSQSPEGESVAAVRTVMSNGSSPTCVSTGGWKIGLLRLLMLRSLCRRWQPELK